MMAWWFQAADGNLPHPRDPGKGITERNSSGKPVLNTAELDGSWIGV
jgi:hypothetical protein